MADGGVATRSRVRRKAMLAMLAERPDLTIDDLIELREEHGAEFGQLTVGDIRAIRTKRRRPIGDKNKLAVATGPRKGSTRGLLKAIKDAGGWISLAELARQLERSEGELRVALADLVAAGRVQYRHRGEPEYAA